MIKFLRDPRHRFLLTALCGLIAVAGCAPARVDERETYEKAVSSLAAGRSEATVVAGYETLEVAGTKAFPVLLAHVKDTAKAAPGHFAEARTDRFGNIEQPTVGDVCYRLVRHEVEGDWPKGFRHHQVLTEDNVTTWWETHRKKSLREMRLETVRISLARAKKDFETNKSETAEAAVRFLTARLEKVERE